jgi:Flp pilus assembly pilin Flp
LPAFGRGSSESRALAGSDHTRIADTHATWRETAMPVLSALKARVASIRRFFAGERGLAVTEYGMLVAFIAIVLIAIVGIFGSQITSWFASKAGQVTSI